MKTRKRKLLKKRKSNSGKIASSSGKRKRRNSRKKALFRKRKRHVPRIEPQAADQAEPLPPAEPDPPAAPGINLIGFSRAEIGVGESSRMAARSLETVGMPFAVMNFPIPVPSDDLTWSHKESDVPLYPVNLFHVNADSLQTVRDVLGEDLWNNRFNIGYWHWELPEMREEDKKCLNYVQEIWTPTNFVQESIAKSSPVPVIKIPHGIHAEISPDMNRGYFGLPDNRFLFLMMYDLQSYSLRKNPRGTLEAFYSAFDKNDPRVGLVLKLNNLKYDPSEMEMLQQLIEGRSNIYILNRTMSRLEVNSLVNVTDSYISLHRAEGFGLGLAEAMFLGKPVIGTNYSGNTDFMNEENSCPVNYQLVQIGQDLGSNNQVVYGSHQLWAEPDLQHAAGYMHRLVEDPEWREMIARNGMHHIRTHYTPGISGEAMKRRLQELDLIS